MWRKIFGNLGLKIIALILAFFLWFNTATNRDYAFEVKFPLKVINRPPNSVIANILSKEAWVKVTGKGKQILKLLLSREKEVVIDVSGFELKENEHILKPEEVKLPETQDLKVGEIISPKTLMIELDHLGKKEVPVQSQVIILPTEGYLVTEEKLEPDKIVVWGPKKFLNSLKAIYTERFEIKGADKPTQQEVKLEIPKKNVNLQLSTQKTLFKAMVQKGIEKRFSGVELVPLKLSFKGKVFFEPESATVVLLGTESSLSKIESESLRLLFDCQELKRGDTVFLKPTLELPQELQLIQIVPDSFKTTLR